MTKRVAKCQAPHTTRDELSCILPEGHEGYHKADWDGLDLIWALGETLAVDETTQAELPVEYRIQRAFLNGYTEGLRRGMEGGLDR